MSSAQSEAALQADLLQLWRGLLQNDAITVDDDFFDMGGDSLLGAELLAEIERRSGRPIPESMLFEASTVRKVMRRLLAPAEIERKNVVEVGPVGNANPMLFFHGDWGDGGFYMKPLARALTPVQPLVAVAPHGMDVGEMPGTVEEMARDRLPELLAYRSHGPYRLGGHCVGGLVALETARLLVSTDHEVEFVAMIDPVWTGSGEPYPTLEGARFSETVKLPLGDPQTEPSEPVIFSMSEGPAGSSRRYEEAIKKYRPVPLSVPIVVFASAFDGRPWQQISGTFELFEHVGHHFDWITVRASQFASHLHTYISARQ
jgi:oxalate---CoA ligase